MRHRTKKHKIKYTKRIQKTKNKLNFSKYKGKKTKKHKKTNKTKKIRKGGVGPDKTKKTRKETREKTEPYDRPRRERGQKSMTLAEEQARDAAKREEEIKRKREERKRKEKEAEQLARESVRKITTEKSDPEAIGWQGRKPNFYFYYKRLREGRKAERDALKNIKKIQKEALEKELDRMETRHSRVWDYDEEEPGESIGPLAPIFTIRDTVQKYINLYKNAFPFQEISNFSKKDFKDILFANILEDYKNNGISFYPEQKDLISVLIDKNVNPMPDEDFKSEDINLTDEQLIDLINLYERLEHGKDALETIQEDSNEEDSSEEDSDVNILLRQLSEEEEEED